MKLDLLAKIRGIFQPHEVVHMKEHEFERGCDDLGQYEGDVERQVPSPAAQIQAPAARDAAKYLH